MVNDRTPDAREAYEVLRAVCGAGGSSLRAAYRQMRELLELLCLLLWIRLSPVRRAVVRIVLRTVDIHVHLVAAVEVELAQTCGVAPRLAIEAFHHSSVGDIGIICDFKERQTAGFK